MQRNSRADEKQSQWRPSVWKSYKAVPEALGLQLSSFTAALYKLCSFSTVALQQTAQIPLFENWLCLCIIVIL